MSLTDTVIAGFAIFGVLWFVVLCGVGLVGWVLTRNADALNRHSSHR